MMPPSFALFGRRRGLPIAAVGPDKVSAYRIVTQRLIELGHQRIVMLNRPARRLPSPGLPELAFIDTLQRAGIATSSYNLPTWDGSVAGIHRILDEMFRLTPPTAVIIDEAQIFLAVQHDLARRGILAPEHVSLVATDQDPYFDYIRPTVAHIRCDTTPWARRITKWADHVAVGKEDRCQTLTKTIFVEGGTIGPPPGKRCAPSRRVIR
jgi:DNA-binding LacI/PurR family transcriptional regulator